MPDISLSEVAQLASTPIGAYLIYIAYKIDRNITAQLHKIDRRLIRVETKLGVIDNE